jgi:hypothetical protein
MVRPQGGRWVVSTKDNGVYVERVSESDESVLEDSLTAGEARELAGLLTKYADKLDESADSGETDDSEDSDDDSEDSDDSDDAGKSGKSAKSDESDESDDSEKSSD